MIAEDAARGALLFFFFGLLNDKLTMQATSSAMKKLKSQDKEAEKISPADFVRVSHSIWKAKSKKSEMLAVESTICRLPSNVPLSSWREFKKQTSPEEFLAVIWAKVLRLPIKAIADGLEVSEGTVRFRLSGGLRKLGMICGGLDV